LPLHCQQVDARRDAIPKSLGPTTGW
jgi:hypothetical protein